MKFAFPAALFMTAVLASGFAPGDILAMPEGADKFAASDADGNGSLSAQEFTTAFPGMRPEAFEVIDINGDKGIDRAEWDAFVHKHSPGAMRGGMDGKSAEPAPQNAARPLIRPPDGQ
ncbi:MAG: hypothetical protein IJU37_13445 [Desulfovibrio sp.]|nr:hypothetical protein [Desulfovibrio sp.]